MNASSGRDPEIPLVSGPNANTRLYQGYDEDGADGADRDPESGGGSGGNHNGNSHPNKPSAGRGWSAKLAKNQNVGERLAMRKILFHKRKLLSDIAFGTALGGILLMVIHMELSLSNAYRNTDPAAILVKLTITLSTLATLGLLVYYHMLNVQLHMIDNGMDDWRLALGFKSLAQIGLELAVVAIHPVPGDLHVTWITKDPATKITDTVDVPADVILSIPMFLRLYMIGRILLLHSKLFADARSQSLGALNRTKFNFYFIFKSLMFLHPVYVLTIVVLFIFLIGSWSLKVCEVKHEVLHASYLNSLWVVAITFLSVGYGDIVPHSYCGRAISVSVGMLGAGCTALVVAVLAQKLEFTRAEKYVHNFVLDVELDKRYKAAAANILINGWRVHRARRQNRKRGEIRTYQRRLHKSIQEIREVKQEQRRIMDSQVTILEVSKSQTVVNDAVEEMVERQAAMETMVTDLQKQVSGVGEKVDSLCRVMAARRERRERRHEELVDLAPGAEVGHSPF